MRASTGNDLRRRLAGDDGMALVVVIGLSFVATLLVIAALSAATTNLPAARFHQDNEAAIAAAEAAVDDLVFRLDRDPAYYLRDDPTNQALTGWAPVPGGEVGGPSYHYYVDRSQAISTGFIDVVATGLVNGVPRTMEARIRRRGFLDQTYLTDYEVLDAGTYFADGSDEAAFYEHHCRRHRDETWTDNTVFFPGEAREFGPLGSRTGRLSAFEAYQHYLNVKGTSATQAYQYAYVDHLYCGEISFRGTDVLRGPVHSNDGIAVRGNTRFEGLVTTAYRHGDPTVTTSDDLWLDWSTSGTATPFFQDGIASVPDLDLPPANDDIEAFAEADGCVYEGPTYLKFRVTGSQPRMDVVSPLTPRTPGGTCGPGTNLRVPDNGVIYVRDATVPCTTHPLEMNGFGNRTVYGCGDGDVFVWGDVLGQYTVASENDVIIVGDIEYQGGLVTGTDVLGLVANNFVVVHHPTGLDGSGNWINLPVPTNPPFTASAVNEPQPPVYADGANVWNSPLIHGALVSLDRSFMVESWSYGTPMGGDLRVRGVIAQRSRGPVATSRSGVPASGYNKDYRYDSRLESLSPPFFIEPVQAAWIARDFAEVDDPAFCTGSEEPAVDGCLPPLP